jgi:hypothetical protein
MVDGRVQCATKLGALLQREKVNGGVVAALETVERIFISATAKETRHVLRDRFLHDTRKISALLCAIFTRIAHRRAVAARSISLQRSCVYRLIGIPRMRYADSIVDWDEAVSRVLARHVRMLNNAQLPIIINAR